MAAIDDMITVFRKETEDLVKSLFKETYLIQYGESIMAEAETKTITLTEAYLNVDDYEIRLFSAIDSDGANVIDSIVLSDKLAGGFKIYSPRPSLVRWQTVRRIPLINYWT